MASNPNPSTQPTPPDSPPVQVDTTIAQQPGDAGAAAKLPHENDQSVDMTRETPHPEMQQAHQDLQKGLVDTDARGADGKPLGQRRPAG